MPNLMLATGSWGGQQKRWGARKKISALCADFQNWPPHYEICGAALERAPQSIVHNTTECLRTKKHQSIAYKTAEFMHIISTNDKSTNC